MFTPLERIISVRTLASKARSNPAFIALILLLAVAMTVVVFRTLAYGRVPGNIASLRGADTSKIVSLTPDGSSEKTLYEGETVVEKRWSPDGSHLAFITIQYPYSTIYVVSKDGGSAVKAAPRFTGGYAGISWSANSSTIAYARTDRTGSDIYKTDRDGGGRKQLTDTAKFNESNPSWSKKGPIVYTRCNSSQQCQIWKMKSDGSAKKELTSKYSMYPVVSYGGGKIAYFYKTSVFGNFQIYTMNLDGSGKKKLTSDGYKSVFSWSYDDSKIAYLRQEQLRVMNADGAQNQSVVETASYSWSPDGSEIAFVKSDGDSEIWLYSFTTGKEVRVTTNDFADTQPEWQALPDPVSTPTPTSP